MSHSTIFPAASPEASASSNSSAAAFTSPLRGTRGGRQHNRSLLRSSLASAFRTALACAIGGIVTVYSPAVSRGVFAFPAFTYATAIIVVGDATVGDALHGAICAVHGTVLGALPALLAMFLVGQTSISVVTTTISVFVSAFVAALAESADLVALRIALGQIVIVYVAIFSQAYASKMQGGSTHKPLLQIPLQVASSTILGAASALAALLFPYPHFASYEIKRAEKLYREMAMKRLRILVDAFNAGDTHSMDALASDARFLRTTSTKLLNTIKAKQGKICWERPLLMSALASRHARISENLQELELPLKGMELAVASAAASCPVEYIGKELERDMQQLRDQISLGMLCQHYPVSNKETLHLAVPQSGSVPQNYQECAPFFFLFCLRHLHSTALKPQQEDSGSLQGKKIQIQIPEGQEHNNLRTRLMKLCSSLNPSSKKILVALKCSLSVALAVLVGVLFSKDNGYWSGLMVAIAVTRQRESTFKLANDRAQGTALGSVYGIVGSLISEHLMELRFVVLLPWIILTSFLRRSRMYGPAGGIAAVLSAMILLGRRNYGPPKDFAVTRLAEAFMGLACSVSVELLLQPTRASTLARKRLHLCLLALQKYCEAALAGELKDEEKNLREKLSKLKKQIEEAATEPNFWCSPFPSETYQRLHASLAKTAELLNFVSQCTEPLAAMSRVDDNLGEDLENLRTVLSSKIGCLEQVVGAKPSGKTAPRDIEQGKEEHSKIGEITCEDVVSSFLRHAEEAMDGIDADAEVHTRSQVLICLASTGFCIGSSIREMRELEKGIRELFPVGA